MTPEELSPKPTDSEQLRKAWLHEMRMLSEQTFGNETYGKYLAFNHELQRIMDGYMQKRDQQRLSAVLEAAPQSPYSFLLQWNQNKAFETAIDQYKAALTAALGPDNI